MKIINTIITNNKKKTKEINSMLDPKKKYILNFSKKEQKLNIYIDRTKLLSGYFYFFGIYQPSTQLWIWASSIPGISNIHIDNIMKLKASAYLFENSKDRLMNFYYQLLTQDVLLIPKMELLNKVNQLLLYLSDSIYYFNPVNNENNIQFIGLQSIVHRYF
jgi:hypothetical protein